MSIQLRSIAAYSLKLHPDNIKEWWRWWRDVRWQHCFRLGPQSWGTSYRRYVARLRQCTLTSNSWSITLGSHPITASRFETDYHLVNKHSYWTWPSIVDLPSYKMMIFHNYVSLPGRVYSTTMYNQQMVTVNHWMIGPCQNLKTLNDPLG